MIDKQVAARSDEVERGRAFGAAGPREGDEGRDGSPGGRGAPAEVAGGNRHESSHAGGAQAGADRPREGRGARTLHLLERMVRTLGRARRAREDSAPTCREEVGAGAANAEGGSQAPRGR